MLDDLTRFADHFFNSQRQPGQAFAEWLARQIERALEPAKTVLHLKSPARDPEIEQVRQLSEHPLSTD